ARSPGGGPDHRGAPWYLHGADGNERRDGPAGAHAGTSPVVRRAQCGGAGELALEEAVPALAQQLEHEDERVRKAVALALAKIGSRAAAEPLRRALRDESPEVRDRKS